MMATEKLVDGEFLARLVAGSMESAVSAVDEAVTENAGLFGGEADTVRAIATYPGHTIVVNEDGDFYRAKWAEVDGSIVLSEVEEIEVPTFDAKALGPQVRSESILAAQAILSGDDKLADEKLRGLYKLVKSGVRLTAEGVEDLYHRQAINESEWMLAVREQSGKIRAFLGTDALRVSANKPQFSAITDGSVTEQQAEPHRAAVTEALTRITAELASMRGRLALAKQVTEAHRPRDASDKSAPDLTAADFVEFVAGFSEDLDSLIGILSDAQAVAEDGCLKCLSRLHDDVCGQMYECGLATAFCEKLARRFVLA